MTNMRRAKRGEKSTPFSLWAPEAKQVELLLFSSLAGPSGSIGPKQESSQQERRLAMARDSMGWWHPGNEVKELKETDYAFSVEGGPPLPDPRSPRLPHGVHGPSRTFNHSRFSWSDEAWQQPPLSQSIVYELHVGTFTSQGTFSGVAEKLSYLKTLGVTHLELMPVNSFSGKRGWGYDGVGLYAPHEAYGGPDGLKELVDAAHGAGLGVILDVVYNHLGPEGNYLEQFAPYFTDGYKTAWGKAVNLDGPYSHEARGFFIDNALMWFREYHIDALRIDAVHAFYDTSAIHFLEELSAETKDLSAELGKRFYCIAESDLNDPRVVTNHRLGGYGMDVQWSDDFHHSVHSLLTGERDGYYSDFGSPKDVQKVFSNPFLYSGRFSHHRKRVHGKKPEGLAGLSFFSYSQNHDQVGNRAAGERLIHICGPAKAKIAAALVFFSPYLPMIFQGEEWGASTPFQYFTDHGDPELGKAVSEGRRREFSGFGWKPEEVPDPQDAATFHRSCLCWEEQAEIPHRKMLDWYKRLIALRRGEGSLKDGKRTEVDARLVPETATVDHWGLIIRRGDLLCCVNGAEKQELDYGEIDFTENWELLAYSGPEAAEEEPEVKTFLSEGKLRLPPLSVCICKMHISKTQK